MLLSINDASTDLQVTHDSVDTKHTAMRSRMLTY